MENHRNLKKKWQLTESNWNKDTTKKHKVNLSQTKKEKLVEGQVISEDCETMAVKKGLAKDEKDAKNWCGNVRKGVFKKESGKESVSKKSSKATEDVAAAAAGAGNGAVTTPAVGVPNEVPDRRIGRNKKKKKVQTRESYHDVLDRAFNNFVLGDSIVYQEEDDEDMGAPDELPDMDDMGGEEGEMGDMDDLGGEEGEMDDMGGEEMPPMSVPGAGVDPIEARLAAIEARLAAMEGGEASGAVTDLGDELPDGMSDEMGLEDPMGAMGAMGGMDDMSDLDDVNDLGGMGGEFEDEEEESL